jgi:hypothetical protein
MSEAEKGRFCDVCAKCVVDLTGKTQHQIAEIYEEANGDLCGRMPASQAKMALPAAKSNRELAMAAFNHSMAQMRTFAAAFVMAFAFLLGGSPQAKSQHILGKIAPSYQQENTGSLEIRLKSDDISLKNRMISVTVTHIESNEVVYDHQSTLDRHSIKGLKPGNYSIFAKSDGWMAWAETEIEAGKSQIKEVFLEDQVMMLGDIIWHEEPEIEPVQEQKEEGSDGLPPSAEPENGESSPRSSESLQPKEIKLIIFPNPSSQRFTVRVENAANPNTHLTISDSDGRTVWNHTQNTIEDEEVSIDHGHLSGGNYWISASDGETKVTRPLTLVR